MPKGLKRAVGALLIALGLYSLLGFLILPGIALRIANQQLAAMATVPAKLERLELNPFSLEVRAWGLHIGEPAADQIGFQRLYANLQVDSLWTGALHLADVELEKSQTAVEFRRDGTLNLTQLFNIPASPEPEVKDPDAKPFPLRLDRFELIEGALQFADLRPSEPVQFVYDSLNLELKHLSTLPEDSADMTLVAKGPYGGQVDWAGQVSLSPITSTGKLKITDGNMKAFWPYVRDAVPLVLEKGTLSLSTDYTLDLSQGTKMLLTNTTATVASFAMKATDNRPLVNLERLEVSETSVDLAKQLVTIGKIRSQNLETWATREKDGELDWQKLFASKPASKKVEPAPTAAVEQPEGTEAPAPTPPTDPNVVAAKQVPPSSEPTKPWQVLLQDTQLRGYQIHLADRVPKDPVALDIGPLNLDLLKFDSLNGSPFTLKLDTGVGKQGKITASGQVNLNPVNAQLKVTTQDIDLRVAQAYLDPFVRLELRSGLLGSDLAVDLKSTEPLAFSITGRAQVNQLHTLDTLKSRDFVKWKELTLDGLNYKHGDALSIEKVSLAQPYARFMINEDRSTNVSDLVIKQPDEPKANARKQPEPAGKPLGIHIGGIAIDNGSANFADFSLTPNFGTAIQQLNGQIGTLDNRTSQAAKVDIKGKVDRYAPVSIVGSLNPFEPLDALDLTTSFKHVELTTLTPTPANSPGIASAKGGSIWTCITASKKAN